MVACEDQLGDVVLLLCTAFVKILTGTQDVTTPPVV
jgi:hypothetical protein